MVSGRGPPPADLPPSSEQVVSAAGSLGISKEELEKALRLTGNRFAPMNLAASARTPGVEHHALREALRVSIRRRRPNAPPRAPSAPLGGEAPCQIRCATSDENAVACGLKLDHKVLCARPCDNNKCGKHTTSP